MISLKRRSTKITAAIVAATALVFGGVGVSQALAASPSIATPTNIYGCDIGPTRTLQYVYTTQTGFASFLAAHGGKCPNGGFSVTVNSATGGATPTPTPSTSTSAPPTPTPTPTGTTAACVTSVLPHGTCNFASSPNISIIGSDVSPPTVDQNEWTGNPAYTATLTANSTGNWSITAKVNSNFGGVQSFPNTGWGMPYPEVKVDSYTSLPSSWNVTIPTDNTKNAGWAAYDLWFNNWADEVMIQTDIVANSDYDCTANDTATINGMPWHLCTFGSERVWKPGTDDQHLQNMPLGSLDIQSFLTYMEGKGELPAGSTWTAGSFGFEIADTQGTNATYSVNSFTFVTKQ